MVEEKLYIGGGVSHSDDDHTVWQYESDQWVGLERYQWRCFAMAAVKKQLTLVGGCTSPWQVTNEIAVWERKGVSHQWTHPYPFMPTRRSSPAVATHNQWLVVAGGRDDDLLLNDLAAVELLNTDTRQWLSTTPLPVECNRVTTAIVQDELYLVGGTLTTTLVVSLPDLVSTDSANTAKLWRTIPSPPLESSAPITLLGAMLAVGGVDQHNIRARMKPYQPATTAIHVYQPATNNWKKVGELPTARDHCACTLLPSGELLVAGGYDSNYKLTTRVDVAEVCSCDVT